MMLNFTGTTLLLIDSPPSVVLAQEDDEEILCNAVMLGRDEPEEGPEAFFIELNDQAEGCTGRHVSLIELSDTLLHIRFTPDSPLRGGRDGEASDPLLTDLVIRFSLSLERLEALSRKLKDVIQDACPFRYVGHALRATDRARSEGRT